MSTLEENIKDFKTSPKEFRERARKLKNKYDDELQQYRDCLLREGKRFGHDMYSYNTITVGMFEAEKGITYKDGEYFEYRMEYSPIIDGFSNGYGDYAGLNEGFAGGIFMQRTGLYDTKGVKIFEGDILLGEDTESEYVDNGVGLQKVAEYPTGTIGRVIFREGIFGVFFIEGGELIGAGFRSLFDLQDDGVELEVVGNVFEDSSLLQ